MDNIINFLAGPGLIVSLAVFFIGLAVRLVLYFKGLDWRLERVAYRSDMAHGLKGGFYSAFKWLLPYGTHGWRAQPFVATAFLLLHIGAVLLPLFLLGHNVVLKEALGVSLFSMPQALADVLTVMAIIGIVLLALRRIALPEVRILTDIQDWFLLVLVFVIFMSGFLTAQEIGDAQVGLLIHIVSGELLLLIAPFTKMSHIALYFASRIQIGMDFAIKRGGHSRKSGAFFPW